MRVVTTGAKHGRHPLSEALPFPQYHARTGQAARSIIMAGSPCEIHPRLLCGVAGHIRAQLDIVGVVHCPVLRGCCPIRVVRRPPRQHQQERALVTRISLLLLLRVAPEERFRVVRLRPGIVAIPRELRIGISGVVERLVVVVGALQCLPVLEALPALWWDVVAPAVSVDMPLPSCGAEICSDS